VRQHSVLPGAAVSTQQQRRTQSRRGIYALRTSSLSRATCNWRFLVCVAGLSAKPPPLCVNISGSLGFHHAHALEIDLREQH
jgi:hypothetical protein